MTEDPTIITAVAVGTGTVMAGVLKGIDMIRSIGKSNGNGNGNGKGHGEGDWPTRHDEVVKAVGQCVGKIDSLEETIRDYVKETHDMTQRLFDKIEDHADRIKALEVKGSST